MSIYDKMQAVAINLVGKFKNPKTIDHQRYTNTSDGMGGSTQTWASVGGALEGAVIPMTGDEILQAQRIKYEASHYVYLTYGDGSDIQPEDRLVFDSRTFAVIDPRNVAEADAVMKIMVKEGVGN